MDLRKLKTLIDQPGKLPTVPKVTQKLIESFSDEDVSIDEIARQLAADPALTAKLLRLANSAYFHVSRTIGTVDDALRMLGFVMVRNLVLGNGMVAAFRNTPGLDMKQFWRYNLYTACAARWLARQGKGNGDLAFTLGLMHGIGQLQMHAVAPAAVAPRPGRFGCTGLPREGDASRVLSTPFARSSNNRFSVGGSLPGSGGSRMARLCAFGTRRRSGVRIRAGAGPISRDSPSSSVSEPSNRSMQMLLHEDISSATTWEGTLPCLMSVRRLLAVALQPGSWHTLIASGGAGP